ncbi:MAG: lactate racemase domain-containing protein [Terriglobia bacterium]
MTYGNGYNPAEAAKDCVVYLDKDSAPRVLFCGEDLVEVNLPPGTRVVYAKPPIPGLKDRTAAIRHAIEHPENMEPLAAQLRPGMKVTIATDDISLPLPMMRRPDIRQSVLEIVLELLAAQGIDDIHIIIATSFHRRMTAGEIRRCVGKKTFNAFYPERLYNYDGEDPQGTVELGRTELGESARISRRAAESDLLIYVNINLSTMDGGHKSVGVGLCDYPTLRAHHTPQAILASNSYMDPGRSALAHSCDRIGRIIDNQLKLFHIETALNNRMFNRTTDFLARNEDHFSAADKIKLKVTRFALSQLSTAQKRKLYFSIPAAYELIGVHAGETEATHRKILQYCYDQYCIPVEGQSDVVIYGITFVSPYNVNSIMNPILVQVMALGYFFNFYRNMPIVKKNGVLILTHPCYDEFDPAFHPSYIEFFNRVLTETRDSLRIQKTYEAEFAADPGYIKMYREGNAYHGVHPFYMWYWGENGRAHLGKVIVVGAVNKRVPAILGWETADSMEQALEMAEAHVGHKPSITLLHFPPILMTDVMGTPETIPPRARQSVGVSG